MRFYRLRGRLREASRLVSALWAGLGQSAADHEAAVRREVASTLYYLGDFREVLAQAEFVAAPSDPDTRLRTARFVANDPYASCVGYAGLACWFLGRFAEAERRTRRATRIAVALGHAHTHVVTVLMEAMVAQFSGRPRTTAGAATRMVHIGSGHGLVHWTIAGDILRAWRWATLDPSRVLEAVALLQSSIRAWEDAGARLFTPYWYALLAAAGARAGLLDIPQRRDRDRAHAQSSRVRRGGTRSSSACRHTRTGRETAELSRDEVATAQHSPALALRVALDRAITHVNRQELMSPNPSSPHISSRFGNWRSQSRRAHPSRTWRLPVVWPRLWAKVGPTRAGWQPTRAASETAHCLGLRSVRRGSLPTQGRPVRSSPRVDPADRCVPRLSERCPASPVTRGS